MFTREQTRDFIARHNPFIIEHRMIPGGDCYGARRVDLHVGGRIYSDAGGGFDLRGSVIGQWLSDCPEFMEGCRTLDPGRYYGLSFYSTKSQRYLKRWQPGCHSWLHGACGEGCMARIFQRVTGARWIISGGDSRREHYRLEVLK